MADLLKQQMGTGAGSRPFPQLGTPVTLSGGQTGYLSDNEDEE